MKKTIQGILLVVAILLSGCTPQDLVKLNVSKSKRTTTNKLPRLEEMRRTADRMEKFNKMTNEDIAIERCKYIEYRNNKHKNCYNRELRRLRRQGR